MAILGPKPMASGEMRPFVDHTWSHFAAVRCPGCGLDSYVSEQEFRLLSTEPDSHLTCRGCHTVFQPVERLNREVPPGQGLPPRPGGYR